MRTWHRIAPVLMLAAGVLDAGAGNSEKSAGARPETPPHTILTDPAVLAANKQAMTNGSPPAVKEGRHLLGIADKILASNTIYSVTFSRRIPPGGDRHDYTSQSKYYWPNPKTPNRLPYIYKDGERNPESDEFNDHLELDHFIRDTRRLALAYYFSGDGKYAQKAAKLLRAWFIDQETRMNPNLNHVGIRPGIDEGSYFGIIETASLPEILDCIELVRPSGALTSQDLGEIRSWFEEYLHWLRASKPGEMESESTNNHAIWYGVQVAGILEFLGRDAEAADFLKTEEPRLTHGIRPDGSQPREFRRTKAWSYSLFNLNACVELAHLAQNAGVDLWHYQSPTGGGLKKAIEILIPYALHHETWPYKEIGKWDNTPFATVLYLAAPVYNPQWTGLADSLPLSEMKDPSLTLGFKKF